MQIGIEYGREHLDIEVQESNLVRVQRAPPSPVLPDPAAALRSALETPVRWPALRRALTPDDHVAILVDEQLPCLGALLTVVVEHLAEAKVAPEAVTILCPPSSTFQGWVEDLPDALGDLHIEVHDPGDRKKLSYLATTKAGRRLYLNRTAVDADQLVVLTRRGYDPVAGYSGAEQAIYPALSDEATRKEMGKRLSLSVPGGDPWPVQQEAAEAAWLLGAPFLVQVIEGSADGITHVLGGSLDSSTDGQRLLDTEWRRSVDQLADTVVASVSGNPARHDFAVLAQALAAAARVVQPEGRIILLTQATPRLEAGAELLRQVEQPRQAIDAVREQVPADMAAVFQWASAVSRAKVYLLSGLAEETADELFTVPLEHAAQVQRLLGSSKSCLLLPDAHKSMAVVTA